MVILQSESFTNYGQPCAQCIENPFFECINNTCQCDSEAYFDGSVCQLKRFSGGQCNTNNECRTDMNISCLQFQQCGRK